ncbi:hypothetical protein [Streptomyces sp. NPDC005732]
MGRGSRWAAVHRLVRHEPTPGDIDWRESVEYWQKCHFCKIQGPHSVSP